MIVLPAAYMPDAYWFACALHQGVACVGLSHKYQKQTPLSRTCIKGANGVLQLCVQVTHDSRHQPVAHATLSVREQWHRLHQRSLQSAYGRTAFYEHYGPPLLELLETPPLRLVDYNLSILRLLCSSLGIPLQVEEAAVPQLSWPRFALKSYYQPFGSYVPDLSLVDMLMNEGPSASALLRQASPCGE
ncbi:MAG: WbqC family protein [Bacteroidetes bacterium]|nr:WbqC family protein [Bacteroidota bacterium]